MTYAFQGKYIYMQTDEPIVYYSATKYVWFQNAVFLFVHSILHAYLLCVKFSEYIHYIVALVYLFAMASAYVDKQHR
jgi:hypothetical protein